MYHIGRGKFVCMKGNLQEIFLPAIFGVMVVLLVGSYAYQYLYSKSAILFETNVPVIQIDNVSIRVAVASTTGDRARGLSGTVSLGGMSGMFFVFDKADYHGIWMKDMRYPIDVIWIDESFNVVDVTANLRPESYPEVFEPIEKARFAIETNALFTKAYQIDVGDKVGIPEDLIPEDLKKI